MDMPFCCESCETQLAQGRFCETLRRCTMLLGDRCQLPSAEIAACRWSGGRGLANARGSSRQTRCCGVGALRCRTALLPVPLGTRKHVMRTLLVADLGHEIQLGVVGAHLDPQDTFTSNTLLTLEMSRKLGHSHSQLLRGFSHRKVDLGGRFTTPGHGLNLLLCQSNAKVCKPMSLHASEIPADPQKIFAMVGAAALCASLSWLLLLIRGNDCISVALLDFCAVTSQQPARKRRELPS